VGEYIKRGKTLKKDFRRKKKGPKIRKRKEKSMVPRKRGRGWNETKKAAKQLKSSGVTIKGGKMPKVTQASNWCEKLSVGKKRATRSRKENDTRALFLAEEKAHKNGMEGEGIRNTNKDRV